MKKYKVLMMTFAAACMLGAGSCTGDLDTQPIDPDVQLPQDVLSSQEAFEAVLAKCYQGLAVSSSYGEGGGPDIDGLDGGTGQYLRALWNMQCLTTDESVCCWNDPGVFDLHNQCWTASNILVFSMYSRIYYQVGLCNELIRQINANVAGIPDSEFPQKNAFIAEARALRLLSYYHAIDLFGNVPFATEANTVGATGGQRIERGDLFDWMEKEALELLDSGSALADEGKNVYGRCDKGMVRMILAKLYLNAEVWKGTPMYDKCYEQSAAIRRTYSLHKNAADPSKSFAELFMADNHRWTKNTTYNGDEIIFAVNFDGNNTRSYGGTNFLIFAAVGGDMDAASFGIASGWGGLSVTPEFTAKFDDADARKMFFTQYGASIEVLSDFTSGGYKSMKFTNMKSDGMPGQANGFVDTDFPVFRAADAYLMMAECAARGAGSMSEALNAFNEVRARAGLPAVTSFTAKDVLDERAREMMWECCRRQDLVRYGLFTSNDYLWQYKGGLKEGQPVDAHFDLMPIPSSDLNSNGSLVQNPGY